MTSQEIAVQTGSALAITGEQEFWTDKQVSALRQLGVENANNGDLAVFFHQCQRTGLDPFARQIYMIGRRQWNSDTRQNEIKQTIQTGIDGFRLIARRAVDRSHETLGYEDTLWCGKDGKWTDVWLSNEPPAAAKVTVLRNGERYPAIALYTEYAGLKKDGTPTKMWAEKPALMLAKCCEALALRKAFPHDLSGLYTSDELARDDNESSNVTPMRRQQPQQQSRPRTLTEAVASQDQVHIDIPSLLEAAKAESDPDRLVAMYQNIATIPGDEAKAAREKIVELGTAARAAQEKAQQQPEPAPEEPTMTESEVAEVLNAEIVEAS
ncbi:phage recombination protein Bet [Rhodococcus qingshengii]|nr:phage recombination protein Bet [Rhodococcus qingshengii]MDJ0490638.1 phage recombination protein Bet [Rhodococcus qingshengii]